MWTRETHLALISVECRIVAARVRVAARVAMVMQRGDRGGAERSQTENDSLAGRNGRASEFLRQRHRLEQCGVVWKGWKTAASINWLKSVRIRVRTKKRLFRVRVRLVNWI
jgi:hypothetical protein